MAPPVAPEPAHPVASTTGAPTESDEPPSQDPPVAPEPGLMIGCTTSGEPNYFVRGFPEGSNYPFEVAFTVILDGRRITLRGV